MPKAPPFADHTESVGENTPRKDGCIVFGGKVYLARRQVAQHYPISEHTLAKLASEGCGPRFFKPTDKALYLPADIEAWIEAAAVLPMADAGAPKALALARPSEPKPQKGRGRAKPPLRAAAPPGSSGRRLKSLPPTPNSWLRRND